MGVLNAAVKCHLNGWRRLRLHLTAANRNKSCSMRGTTKAFHAWGVWSMGAAMGGRLM